MISSYDKFLVALIGAIIFALTNWGGMDLGLDQNWINSVVAVLTPGLVALVPNRPRDR